MSSSSSQPFDNELSEQQAPPRRVLPLLRSSVAARYAKERTRVDDPREVILSRTQVRDLGAYWLRECENKGHSHRTVDFRRDVLRRLDWFLENRTAPDARDGEYYCGVRELRDFMAHLQNGHKEPGGRFGGQWGRGNGTEITKGGKRRHNSKMLRPMRPLTIHRYWRELHAFFSFLVIDRVLSASPMWEVEEPDKKTEQIPHLTEDQVERLVRAAAKTKYPKRDTAIVFMLLDTGLRASELCNLHFRDVDFYGGVVKVLGKGNKYRNVPFESETGKILRAYVRYEIGRDFEEIDPNTPLFLAERGGNAGKPISTDGLRQLLYRLARMAGINRNVTKCSPHVMRHTFAYLALMGNASEKALKEMLGHTTLHMTHQYVNLAESDVKRNHRQFSPVEYLKREKNRR